MNYPNGPEAHLPIVELCRWWDSTMDPSLSERVRPVLLTSEGHLHVRCWDPVWKTWVKVFGKDVMRLLNNSLPGSRVNMLVVWLAPLRALVAGSPAWRDERLAELLMTVLEDTWHDVIQDHGPDEPFEVLHGDHFTGADFLARAWAIGNGLPCQAVPRYVLRNFDPRGVDLVLAFAPEHCSRTATWTRQAEEALVPVRTFRRGESR